MTRIPDDLELLFHEHGTRLIIETEYGRIAPPDWLANWLKLYPNPLEHNLRRRRKFKALTDEESAIANADIFIARQATKFCCLRHLKDTPVDTDADDADHYFRETVLPYLRERFWVPFAPKGDKQQ